MASTQQRSRRAALLTLQSDSEASTVQFGISLGRVVDEAVLVLLRGGLGSGKTAFVRGVALGLDVSERVTSPTFVLEKRYEGRLPLLHLDCYRLDSPAEALDFALSETDDRTVVMIEWPEHAETALPPADIEVELEPAGDSVRLLRCKAVSERGRRLLDLWIERGTAE